MAFSQRLFLAVVFSTLICGGYSRVKNCFYCDSSKTTECLDVNKYDDETLSRVIPMSPCANNLFCQKTVQTIPSQDPSNHEPQVRVIRSCGLAPKDQPGCYSTDQETVCYCLGDRCNSAESADPASSVFLFLVFSAVLYFYR